MFAFDGACGGGRVFICGFAFVGGGGGATQDFEDGSYMMVGLGTCLPCFLIPLLFPGQVRPDPTLSLHHSLNVHDRALLTASAHVDVPCEIDLRVAARVGREACGGAPLRCCVWAPFCAAAACRGRQSHYQVLCMRAESALLWACVWLGPPPTGREAGAPSAQVLGQGETTASMAPPPIHTLHCRCGLPLVAPFVWVLTHTLLLFCTAAQANLWIAILSFIGNYLWTHYFYKLLGAAYTFKAWRLNDVRGRRVWIVWGVGRSRVLCRLGGVAVAPFLWRFVGSCG